MLATVLLLPAISIAQTYLPSNGTTYTTCGGTFYDSGGAGGNYSDNENSTTTFCPSTAGQKISVTCPAGGFNLESGFDYLKVYDGTTTAAPLLGNFTGTTITSPVTATNAGGCLCFKFTSDISINYSGWTLNLSCVTGSSTGTATGDECASAIPIPVNSTCVYTNGTTVGATPSSTAPAPGCANFLTGTTVDVWYSFVATSASMTLNSNTGTITDGGMALYSGTCAGLTLVECDDDDSPNGFMPMIQRTDFIPGNTYYIRMWNYSGSTTGTFSLCLTAPPVLSCPSGLGTGVVTVASLPYSSGNVTTCGMVNDLNSTNVPVCGASYYYDGEDAVYVFTPTVTGTTTIALNSTGSYTGLMLYAGCPFGGGTCVTNLQSSSGSKSFCATVTAGVTYYLIIDSWPSPACNPYSLSISAPSNSIQGATCSTAIPMTLPYIATGQSTSCAGNDYTNTTTGACNTLYQSGEDKVYSFSGTAGQCISVAITNANSSNIGFQLSFGCPGSAGAVCVASAGGAVSGALNGSIPLPSTGTYYLIIDSWAPPANVTYDLGIQLNGNGPANDLPCNAVSMILGTSEPGDNSCSGSSGEPAVPACWDAAGARNTVWYRVIPTSTSLRIKTFPGTLSNTQIALYSGTCSALTYVACNDNAGTCGSITNFSSQLYVTGLTAGTTYYIAVDGAASTTGSFDILAIDGAATFPPMAGMDCILPNPVCSPFFQVSDPGYAGFGANCDLPTSYCLASSERNIVWYTIPINAAGNLVFDIVPNDFNVALQDETDYDFALWRTTGTGAVTCSQIAAGTAVPLRCNYSYLGVTGLNGAAGFSAPASLTAQSCPNCGTYNPNPFYNGAYEQQLPVSAGDVVLLAISNFSNSTSGFRIDFRNSPIGYVGNTATSVTWTGGTNTNSALSSNWGGCNVPSCSVDGIVSPFSVQPVISANQTFKNLEIQPGATVTINAGVTVTICGNLINNGNLRCAPTSTILFSAPVSHLMSGNFVGLNALGNLTVSASAAGLQVNLMNDLDMRGSFTTANVNSIFNANGNNLRVGLDFFNNNGNATFLNVAPGFLEFNGTAAQRYNQGLTQLDLNVVNMNHNGPGLTLQTNLCMNANSGWLNLVRGRIITGANEVRQFNRRVGSVTAGSPNSFVQGFLRRWIFPTGAYDFPVGEAVKGYHRANINFTSATTIDHLLGYFSTHTVLPPPLNIVECNRRYNFDGLNNGKWTINAYNAAMTRISAAGDGLYTMTVQNLPGSYSNNAGNAWTIIKDTTAGGNWFLNGTCDTNSTVNLVRRTA
ncbi:MAG: hypothetical protein RL021_1426, partial [Bacteroidota bacterium]